MRSYLKVYFDFDDKTEALSDAEKGRLLLAMYRYALTGEKPVLSGNERFLFATFKGEIDRDVAAYNTKIANGNLGGRPSTEKPNVTEAKPKETESNRTKPKETETPKNKNKEKEEEDLKESTLTGTKEKRKRFLPPTVEKVAEYCKERNNGIDPQHFIDYYAARGWELKPGQKIKDWRACIRTWEQRKSSTIVPIKQVSAQQYEQRQRSKSEWDALDDISL